MEDVAVDNQESLRSLVRAIALSQGEFSLILIRCNYTHLREKIEQQLPELCHLNIHTLVLDKSIETLYTTIKKALKDKQPQALMVSGLELVHAIDQVIVATNQVREEFRKSFPFPIILWMNDEILQKFIRLAPDFDSWATTIEFAITTDELSDFLQEQAEQIFANYTTIPQWICVSVNVNDYAELAAACQDLQSRGQVLNPELQASLEFIQGLNDFVNCRIDAALKHYQQSLLLLEQSQNCYKQGILLLNIALSYYRQAEQYRVDSRLYWEESSRYFLQSLNAFEKAQRPDLVAAHITKLSEIWRRLQAWEKLQALAQKALTLHQIYQNPSQLAQDYGCLAEVALEQSHWSEASQLAQQALQILSTISNRPTNEGGLYWFILGRAQECLEQLQEAISSLERAIKENNPQYDPPLYISILKNLRSLYFKQGEYRKAFEIRQEQQSIEAQYGCRPFTGGRCLQPIKRVINPAIDPVEPKERAREQITASGRRSDLNNLLNRLSRNDYKLIVIHGMSGVGKSSLLWAGLVPELKQKPIGDRNVIPVVLRRVLYTNWVRELARLLGEALQEAGLGEIELGLSAEAPESSLVTEETLDSTEAIVALLKKNAERNLLTVLVFDQFEEFFFTCTSSSKRRQFYEFLQVCLDLPYVKLILSIREDYLHYLLECDRYTKLDAINQNILDKNIRYYLGDFPPEHAKSVILELTERSQFYLEPELIDELVQDLASELGAVRPIELQVVGAQLQTDNITTLEQYHQLGSNPKEKLVQRSLEEVIKDCGPENERAARLVLYLLTNENGTRPLKTRDELVADLKLLGFEQETENLDLVLEILVGSGLVFMVPESPANRHQLVHDYLVAFIRQQQAPGLLAELAAAKEKQKLTEEQLRQALREKERALQQEQKERKRAEIAEIEALISLSQALWLSHDQLGSLVAIMKAGIQLQETEVPPPIKLRVVERVRQAVLEIREQNRFIGHSNWVTSVSFSPDGKTIASASADRTIKLWSREGTLLHILQGHRDIIWAVSFSPDSKAIASASADGTIKIWSRNGSLLDTLQGHSDQVYSVSFSPDSKTILSASADKTIKVWSKSGALLKTLKGHNDQVLNACFSPDGTMIASTSADATIKLWSRDVKNRHKDGILLKTIYGHSSSVNCVSFSPTNREMIVSASEDKTVKLWSKNGKLLKTLEGHNSSVNSISFSFDGHTIASASEDKTVKLWSKNGKLLKTLEGHSSSVSWVSFSSDGRTIASAGADKTVRLWSRYGMKLQTSEELDALLMHSCDWVRDYLQTNPHLSEGDRHLCNTLKSKS